MPTVILTSQNTFGTQFNCYKHILLGDHRENSIRMHKKTSKIRKSRITTIPFLPEANDCSAIKEDLQEQSAYVLKAHIYVHAVPLGFCSHLIFESASILQCWHWGYVSRGLSLSIPLTLISFEASQIHLGRSLML